MGCFAPMAIQILLLGNLKRAPNFSLKLLFLIGAGYHKLRPSPYLFWRGGDV